MESQSEQTTPLLPKPRRKCHYWFQFITSKGAILMLIHGALMRLFISSVSNMLDYAATRDLIKDTQYLMIVAGLPQFFYPLVGLIADMRIGRYRMVIGSTVASFIVWLVFIIAVTLVGEYPPKEYLIHTLLAYIAITCVLLSYLSYGCLVSVLIPFNIDQLMGASADELSATVYWHIFSEMAADMIIQAVIAFLIFYVGDSYYVYLSISGVSITASLCLHSLCSHWVDTTPQYYNPLKLIFQVLNYARKNKYPQNRSALTYWIDNYPSRLDLGMDKYGGPFTVEEVEDVKTFFRLLLILVSIFGLALCIVPNHVLVMFNFLIPSLRIEEEITYSMVYVGTQYLFCSIFILLHQFIIYPCFSNYIPSLLRRISIGLVFAVISQLCYIILLPVGHVTFTSAPLFISIDYKWILIPQFLYSIALFLIYISSLEFIVAQSPKSMRGLMVGLWYAARGLGSALSIALPFFIHIKVNSKVVRIFHSYAIFYFIVCEFAVVLVICICFPIIAKCYKYRVREDIVPVNRFAEEYYERFLGGSGDSNMTDYSSLSLSND